MSEAHSCKVVALTGGIASGKTAVSDRFAALGVPVIDTDVIAREVVQPGSYALQQIVETFGAAILLPDGSLDRKALGKIVFAETAKRRQLEKILHPEILKRARHKISLLKDRYCIIVIPLLAEQSRVPEYIDRVLLVDVDEKTQIRRLMQRDNIDQQEARMILSTQATRSQRAAIADDIIVNESDLAHVDSQVAHLHNKYKKLSKFN